MFVKSISPHLITTSFANPPYDGQVYYDSVTNTCYVLTVTNGTQVRHDMSATSIYPSSILDEMIGDYIKRKTEEDVASNHPLVKEALDQYNIIKALVAKEASSNAQ